VLLLVFSRRSPPAPGDGAKDLPGPDDADLSRGAGIRCPKCRWTPRSSDRWRCDCGFVWNTFDTRGLCPACQHQWEDTQCPACGRWSRHVDWYEG
jgi:hypothetical protein